MAWDTKEEIGGYKSQKLGLNWEPPSRYYIVEWWAEMASRDPGSALYRRRGREHRP